MLHNTFKKPVFTFTCFTSKTPKALENKGKIHGGKSNQKIFTAIETTTYKKERKQILDSLENETRSIIIYEAPHRLVRTLEELHEVLGDRSMTLCRELTKKHESVFKSTLGEILAYHRENPPKGECVMIIEGKSFQELKEQSQEEFLKIPLSEHMNRYMDQGYSKKEAMKLVAKDRGVGKREIYQQLLEEE